MLLAAKCDQPRMHNAGNDGAADSRVVSGAVPGARAAGRVAVRLRVGQRGGGVTDSSLAGFNFHCTALRVRSPYVLTLCNVNKARTEQEVHSR